ncbi:YaaA family protein [uncultured Veillonella sp.]|uniref:YaaA family protein n=1 Tax=uncultured Veillonella sp. TaxID=159268 RepID=UPI0025EDE777|nr:YaaA family protein [uncultured Veillonella sp.]MDY3974423.1 YaaA family protein [Veillonella caviae]
MKILLSPSKTKVLYGSPSEAVFHEPTTAAIVEHIQSLDEATFAKALKLKGDKGAEWYSFYQSFATQPVGAAVQSYSGLAFKNLDWAGLNDDAKLFGEAHLCILSALYGLVHPMSPIADYRLDFVDSIYKGYDTSLYDLWRERVNEALASEDWLLNLASKEYSKLIDHPRMVTVEFLEHKNDVWKQLSTSSKQMRGRLAHYMLSSQAESWKQLPQEIDEFHLEGEIPSSITEACTIVYKRQA